MSKTEPKSNVKADISAPFNLGGGGKNSFPLWNADIENAGSQAIAKLRKETKLKIVKAYRGRGVSSPAFYFKLAGGKVAWTIKCDPINKNMIALSDDELATIQK